MVYPTAVEAFVCDPVRIPSIWQHVCAIAFDHTQFAAVWATVDRATETITLYDTYQAPIGDLAVHIDAIRRNGSWIPVLFDIRGNGRSQTEGRLIAERLITTHELDLYAVPVEPEAGVTAVAEQLGSGQLRVFRTMADWLAAYRRYRRSEAGTLLDAGSHLMNATALLGLYGRDVAVTENVAVNGLGPRYDDYDDGSGRCPITGY
jgi:hypothetical protein